MVLYICSVCNISCLLPPLLSFWHGQGSESDTVNFQAFSSRKEGEDAYVKIREALDSMDNKSMAPESRVSTNKPQEQVNGNLGHRNQLISSTSEPAITGDSSTSNLRVDSDKNEAQVPSDIITSCVATLLMIQVSQ